MAGREGSSEREAPRAGVVGLGGRSVSATLVGLVMDTARTVELKRVEPACDLGPYVFDRRRARRSQAVGDRLAVIFGRHGGRWLLPLELRDTSANGLGLVCEQPLSAGDRVTLYDQGRRATYIRGLVTRCHPREDGRFDVGLTCAP